MSATATPAGLTADRSLVKLAPLFARAVAEGLNRAWRAGLDPVVYEGMRSDELQRYYYGQGREGVPFARPGARVTNARSARYSWHFYGLAVDIISRQHGWSDAAFFGKLAVHMKADGLLDWGGDWPMRDTPHFQWGRLKPSPSDRARELYDGGGLRAVWEAVGAL